MAATGFKNFNLISVCTVLNRSGQVGHPARLQEIFLLSP